MRGQNYVNKVSQPKGSGSLGTKHLSDKDLFVTDIRLLKFNYIRVLRYKVIIVLEKNSYRHSKM